jgi:hypothetical protein
VSQRHGPSSTTRGRNALPATVVKLRPASTRCCNSTSAPVTTIRMIATAAAVL